MENKDNQVWSDATNTLLTKVITEKIKPSVPVIVRPLVSPAVKMCLGIVNKQAAKIVPDSVDNYINTAINKAIEGDYDAAAAAIGIAGDTLVDIPLLDDAHEKNMFVTVAQAIVYAIKGWIEKKKAE